MFPTGKWADSKQRGWDESHEHFDLNLLLYLSINVFHTLTVLSLILQLLSFYVSLFQFHHFWECQFKFLFYVPPHFFNKSCCVYMCVYVLSIDVLMKKKKHRFFKLIRYFRAVLALWKNWTKSTKSSYTHTHTHTHFFFSFLFFLDHIA